MTRQNFSYLETSDLALMLSVWVAKPRPGLRQVILDCGTVDAELRPSQLRKWLIGMAKEFSDGADQ